MGEEEGRGGKEEERGGRLSAGVGSCRRAPTTIPPGRRKGALVPAWNPSETAALGRRGASPLGGDRRSLPGPGAAEASGVPAGQRTEPAAALGGRARLSGWEGRRVGRGGAGPVRRRAPRPRLRLPRPPELGPRGRAGTRVPPGGWPAPGARGARRCGPALSVSGRARAGPGAAAVAGGGEEEDRRKGSGEQGRKGRANIVTAGRGNSPRILGRAPRQAPARRPAGRPTAPGPGGPPDCDRPASLSFLRVLRQVGKVGHCSLTFYSRVPWDRVVIKLTSWEASAPGQRRVFAGWGGACEGAGPSRSFSAPIPPSAPALRCLLPVS